MITVGVPLVLSRLPLPKHHPSTHRSRRKTLTAPFPFGTEAAIRSVLHPRLAVEERTFGAERFTPGQLLVR